MKKPFVFSSEDAIINLTKAFALQRAIGEEECKVFHLEYPAVAVVPIALAEEYAAQYDSPNDV